MTDLTRAVTPILWVFELDSSVERGGRYRINLEEVISSKSEQKCCLEYTMDAQK